MCKIGAKMDYKDFKIDGEMVMDYCGESKDVVIPNGVTDIFFQAFCESKDIESVSIPGSVKEVPPFVFAMFDCLQKVTINEGVLVLLIVAKIYKLYICQKALKL